jgi:hypothetical protein
MRRLLRLLCLTAAAETRNAGHPARAAEARTWITAPGADASLRHGRSEAAPQPTAADPFRVRPGRRAYAPRVRERRT